MSTASELSSSSNISKDGSQLARSSQSPRSNQADKSQTLICINDQQKQRKRQLQEIKDQMQIKANEKIERYNLYKDSLSDESKLKQKYDQIEKFYNQAQKKINGVKRQRKQHSKEIKDLITQSVNQENLPRGIVAHKFKVPYSSTCRIAREDDLNSTKKYYTPNLKLNDEHMVSLMELIEDSADITQNQIKEHFKNNFNLNISQPAISNALKKLDITWKSAKVMPPDWNSIAVIEARAKFCNQLSSHMGKELIYVDESSFNLGMSNGRGYAKKGKPALITCSIKKNSLTLIDSLSSERGQLSYTLDNQKALPNNAFNNEKFNYFLLKLSSEIENTNSTVIFFDNSNVHTNISKEVKNTFKSKGIQYSYLPPYSPFLNPIEHYFNMVKKEVKSKKATDMYELVNFIKIARKKAGTIDLANSWFKQVARYYQQCIAHHHFTGNILKPSSTFDNSSNDL